MVDQALSFCPETNPLDNLVLLGHVQVLVLEKQLQVVLAEVANLGVVYQVGEVAADEGEKLRKELLRLELEADVQFVIDNVPDFEVWD